MIRKACWDPQTEGWSGKHWWTEGWKGFDVISVSGNDTLWCSVSDDNFNEKSRSWSMGKHWSKS